MSRGPNIDRERVRQEILDVCLETIRKKGAGAVSARKIAAGIGCSVGTIYNIYKNIDAIIFEINGATIDYLKGEVIRIVEKNADPLDSLLMFGRLYVEFSRTNYNLWHSLLEYPRKHGKALPEWYQRKVDEIFSVIAAVIAPLVEDDPDKATMATKVLWAGFHGISSLAISGRLESVKADTALMLVESLIINYIAGMRNCMDIDRRLQAG